MNSKTLLPDLRSGIVVFLVALPLCLGIALACGVPLFSGIISGVIGGIVITSISGSRLSVSGPAAGLTAIVISGIAEIGLPSFLAAVVLAGLLQFVLGISRLGSIGNYIPNAVIKGMLAGIGIILIIKQTPHFLGYEHTQGATQLFEKLNQVTPAAMVCGLVSAAVILLTETSFYKDSRFLSFIPGFLLAVIAGSLANLALVNYSGMGMAKTVNLPDIHSFRDLKNNLLFPSFDKLGSFSFWLIVFTLSMVASLESLLCLEAIEKLDPRKHHVNPNRELIAQGVGNICAGLLGGLPVTSVIVRSSANIAAGAKTKLSPILHAVLLFLSVLFFPGLLRLIPASSLAVILIFTGYKLAQLAVFKDQYKAGWNQFLPFITTIAVMLLTDLLKGVIAGIIVAVIYIVRNDIRSSFDIMEEKINGRMNYLVRLPQHITFFNKGYLRNFLRRVKKDSVVIIDGSITKTTDRDVQELWKDFSKRAAKRNIEVQFIKYKF